jgi:hypothetical protein
MIVGVRTNQKALGRLRASPFGDGASVMVAAGKCPTGWYYAGDRTFGIAAPVRLAFFSYCSRSFHMTAGIFDMAAAEILYNFAASPVRYSPVKSLSNPRKQTSILNGT